MAEGNPGIRVSLRREIIQHTVMLMGEVNNSEQREHFRQEVLQAARDHPHGTGLGSEHRGSTGTGREGEEQTLVQRGMSM